MAGISSPGVGSGLDIKTIVEALVKSDIEPAKNRLDKQEASLTTQLSALGLVKSTLSKLQTSITKLTSLSSFYSYKVSVSDPNILGANLDDGATAASYEVSVEKLANKQSLASIVFPNASSAIGSGSMTIEFGAYNSDHSAFTLNADKAPVTINIAPGQNSLTAIRDAINNSGSGVVANIVQDSQGSRLTLSSPQTGKDYAMRITTVDSDTTNGDSNGLSALAYDPVAGINSMSETVTAQDSEIKINGLTLTNSSNQLKSAIEGMTLDLKKAQPGTLVYINAEKNQAQLTAQINDFIKQYNETMTTLNNLTSYDIDSKKAGIMQSDAGIRALKFNLSKWIGQEQNGNGSLRSLSDIGIKSDSKGLLSLKTDQFNKILETHYNEIGALFAQSATASDPNIKIKNVPGNIKGGEYNITLDDFNPGVSLSGTIGGIIATSANGQTLKGSGTFKDLTLDVIGGGTGNRGSILVADGLAAKLSSLLDDYLGEQGNLTVRSKTLDKRLGAVSDQRGELQTRAESIYRRYFNQFTALDGLLSQLQSSSQFLTQQLASLSSFSKGNS